MKFLIITGLSGAGKTQAANVLEDMDYYCVDNMPTELLPRLVEFCLGAGGRYEKVALVTDIRDRGGAESLQTALDQLRDLGCDYRILFMEADTRTLIRRYKETRRPHPLQAEAGSLEAAVGLEAGRLERLRETADFRVDTSRLTLGQLQSQIYRLLSGDEGGGRRLHVTVMAFGFKDGIPAEADMVLDVRFLPNPFYVEELREKTGLDAPVYDYVMSHAAAGEFLRRVRELLLFLLPHYLEEGKHSFTLAVGCTGGHHRSVALARAIHDALAAQGYDSVLSCRDLER